MVSAAELQAQKAAISANFLAADGEGQGSTSGSPANVVMKENISPPSGIEPGKAFKSNYTSNTITVPDDFLRATPPDAQPLTIEHIDFAASVLPEYAGHYAVVLDNVISPSECETLLQLAESSVHAWERGEGGDAWQPALVNIGGGFEILTPEYRNSDRIIWDKQTVVDRLWERCLAAPGLREELEVVERDVVVLGTSWSGRPQRWEFRRLNDRMRFLRYKRGQFFRPHRDAPYREPEKDMKTLFTLHLYLNDSKQTVGEGAELEGGATSFLSNDERRKMDVDPKTGRVLIFQHRNLVHSGDDVIAGTKYTMRTDIMYELVPCSGDLTRGRCMII